MTTVLRTALLLLALVLIGALASTRRERIDPAQAADRAQVEVSQSALTQGHAPTNSEPASPAAMTRADEAATRAEAGPEALPAPTGVRDLALTAAEARALMERIADERACERAAHVLSGKSEADLERLFWQWLPPEQAAAERVGRQQAAARLGKGCPNHSSDPAAQRERERVRSAQVARAAAAGDLAARLESLRPANDLSDVEKARWRALLQEVLLSGDLELMPRLGDFDFHLDQADYSRDPVRIYHRYVWALLACDLGRPCDRGSPALDDLCLSTSSSACNQESVEAAIRYYLQPHMFAGVQQRRAELLVRIRSGQIAGIFDPAPQPPPPGP